MARWTISNPHPTKINIFIGSGEWVAKHGTQKATAPFRLEHSPGIAGRHAVRDMGKFDALDALCAKNPSLWDAGYVVLEH